MTIVILAWGNLFGETPDLPITGDWQTDGPVVWIEFARIAKAGHWMGCLTPVLDERNGVEVSVRHAISSRPDMAQAIADLQALEGCSPYEIGSCEIASGRFATTAQGRHPKSCDRIRAWATPRGFDAVIWTAWPRRFQEAIQIPFSPAAAVTYLDGLLAPARARALDYIHHAPAQTMTPFRSLLLTQHPTTAH